MSSANHLPDAQGVSASSGDAAAHARVGPMDERTLTALKGSIEKWRAIESGDGEDLGTVNCPLCREFMWRHCCECPVAQKSGRPFCKGTPHSAWADAQVQHKWHSQHKWVADTPELVALARAEREFLESLLPKPE